MIVTTLATLAMGSSWTCVARTFPVSDPTTPSGLAPARDERHTAPADSARIPDVDPRLIPHFDLRPVSRHAPLRDRLLDVVLPREIEHVPRHGPRSMGPSDHVRSV